MMLFDSLPYQQSTVDEVSKRTTYASASQDAADHSSMISSSFLNWSLCQPTHVVDPTDENANTAGITGSAAGL
jgi:hypothetical protein